MTDSRSDQRHDRPSTPERATEPEFMDVAQLALHLSVTTRFIRRPVAERRVPYYKVGKFIRFHNDDIDDWMAEQRVERLEYFRIERAGRSHHR